jgi:ABC-type glycerol-3-phosphate transport system substrate-binding protein
MKKIVAVFLSVALLALSFAGCGKQENTSDASQTASVSASSSDKDIKANLRILYPGTTDLEKEIASDITNQLKQTYPNISTEFIYLSWADLEKKLAVMIQSGDYPDIMQVQDIVNPVAMNALEPLDSYLEKSTLYDKSMFSTVGIESKSVNGKLYAMPMALIPYSHVVNTDLFKKANIDPKSMKSWDDVTAAAKAINKDGVSGYAMANGGEGRFTFRDFMMISLSNGFTPDDTSDATKSKYIETLSFIQKLSPYMPKSQSTWLYPELFKAWEAGTVGMMHTGAYFTANVISHGKEAMKRTEIVPMPAGPSSDKQTIMVGSNGYSIIAGSTQKEAAWKFIEVALSEPILGKLCGSLNVPAVNYLPDDTLLKYAKIAYGDDVGEQHIALVKEFQAAADKYGVPMPSILGQSAMEKVVQGAIVKMINNSMTPEQAYDEIKKGIDEVKAQQK